MADTQYLGNPNLKKTNVPVQFTKDQVMEFIKCKEDPIYFALNYFKIVSLDHGVIPFRLYDFQQELIRSFHEKRFTICKMPRQTGKSTTCVAFLLHYLIVNDNVTIGILANKASTAREILGRLQLAYENLPQWMQHGIVSWNKGSVEFENGCKIIAGSTSSRAIRGKSISFLYIDETAFVENWDEFFASVFPTISSGETTKMLYTSTPNGLNHFYKTCEGAKENINGFEYVEVPWQRVPGRDDKWKTETLAAMDNDTQKFTQEFECGFLGSSGTLIEGSTLKSMVIRNPIHETKTLKMYESPEEEKVYVLVADVSRGKGLDYSAFTVVDVTTTPYKQVCTFRDNMTTPMDYAEIIYRVISNYNNCYVLIEINDIGEQVSDILINEFEVDTLLFTEHAGRSGKRVTTGFSGKGADKGIRTTKTVKSIGCNTLKLLVEQDQLIITDFDTLNELSTFSRRKNSYEAEPGANDDTVMCLVLFAWLSTQAYFKELTDINTMQLLKEGKDEAMMESMLPMGFNTFGDDAEESFVDSSGDRWFTF